MKATVNLLLNPTRKNTDETRTVSLRVTIGRKRVYYSLGYKAKEKDWNAKTCSLKKSYDPELYEEINITLRNYFVKANTIISELERSKKPVIHSTFRRKFFGDELSNISVLDYFDKVISDLKIKGKIGNSNNYSQSKNALNKFVKNRLLKFEEIDVAFLNRWERELWNTCTGNGISNYMRTLRALYNKAISEEICPIDYYPFKSRINNRGYDISKLEVETIKRALSDDDLEKLKNYKPDTSSWLVEAKNIFFFSFYTMGMNISDICLLKWENVQDGRIKYIRSKNKKPHNIKILPPVQEILNYYEEFDFGTDYIFPAIRKQDNTLEKVRTRVKLYSRMINKNLKTLAGKAEVSNPNQLTTYVARHTWATTMKRRGVSTSLISEAMKHSDERTTQIYLDSFENEVIDEMGEKIM